MDETTQRHFSSYHLLCSTEESQTGLVILQHDAHNDRISFWGELSF